MPKERSSYGPSSEGLIYYWCQLILSKDSNDELDIDNSQVR